MERYGETKTPSTEAPKMLADVGDALILCCKSQDAELTKNLTLLDKRCEELEHFLDANGKAEGRETSGKAPNQGEHKAGQVRY